MCPEYYGDNLHINTFIYRGLYEYYGSACSFKQFLNKYTNALYKKKS